MSRKIWLSIIAVVLLIGTVALIAQEQAGSEQGQRRGQRQKLGAQGQNPATSEPAEIDVAPRPRRMRQDQPEVSAGPNRPIQQRLDRWLNALTKAYKENDREEMGRLIRNMRQARKEMREQRETWQRRWHGVSEQEMDRRRPDRFQPGMERPHEGFGPRHFNRPRPYRPSQGMGIPGRGGTSEYMDRAEPPRSTQRSRYGREWRDWDRAPRGSQGYDDYQWERLAPRRGLRNWDRDRSGWDNYDFPEERPISPRRWDDDVRSEWDW